MSTFNAITVIACIYGFALFLVLMIILGEILALENRIQNLISVQNNLVQSGVRFPHRPTPPPSYDQAQSDSQNNSISNQTSFQPETLNSQSQRLSEIDRLAQYVTE